MRPRFLEKLMTLLKFSDVSLAFGAMPLLDKVSWQIARGERPQRHWQIQHVEAGQRRAEAR
jgi:ABC-type molybdenum transport system ATPase subunit/photorepair protein PhrA